MIQMRCVAGAWYLNDDEVDYPPSEFTSRVFIFVR